MWRQRKNDMTRVQECARLLSDKNRCYAAMIMAVEKYPISADQHLSKSCGRRPWMGQAACSVALDATEEETRIAWNFYMNEESQAQANDIADQVIKQWELGNA